MTIYEDGDVFEREKQQRLNDLRKTCQPIQLKLKYLINIPKTKFLAHNLVSGSVLDLMPSIQALKAEDADGFKSELFSNTNSTDDAMNYTGLKQNLVDRDLDHVR